MRLATLLAVTCAIAVVAEVGLRIAGGIYMARFTQRKGHLFKAPGSLRIVALGESSTAGLWVEKSQSYPRRLQSMLRTLYPAARFFVVVPPHVGQNTSQMANRVEDYLHLYEPDLLILMVGANNEWSLAESHVTKFLSQGSADSLKVRFQVAAQEIRVYKVLRFAAIRLFGERSELTDELESRKYVWGGPEVVRYPPAEWVVSFAEDNREAFVEGWRYDVNLMVEAAKAHGTRVLLMTYHIQPAYLPVDEVVAMAKSHGTPLARNDLVFADAVRANPGVAYVLHDHWHPSPAGYEVIARNALDTIVKDDLLDLGPPAPPSADGESASSAMEDDGS